MNVGLRVKVFNINGGLAFLGSVAATGTSESCEDHPCEGCASGSHVPVTADGDDYAMGVARAVIEIQYGERVVAEGLLGTVVESVHDCEECQQIKHIPVRCDVDLAHSVIRTFAPASVYPAMIRSAP